MMIGLLDFLFGRYRDTDISDWESLYELNTQTHLKQMALDTVIGKIQATASLILFDTADDGWHYRLNVQPNRNQNAVEFRDQLLYRLLTEGEALAVNVSNQLLLADDWTVSDDVVRDKVFSDVTVDGLVLKQRFNMQEVLYFKYHNDHLKRYLRELTDDYAKLFKRTIEVQMRQSQLRVYAKFPGIRAKDSKSQEKFVAYLKGLEQSLNDKSVVVAPRQDDYDIEEKSPGYLGRSSDELGVIENLYLKNVANALQVPPLLFSGDLADISQHTENFVLYCIQPLMELIVTEINRKSFSRKQLKQKRVTYNTLRLLYASEFAMAKDVEKMIGSGVWTVDDVRALQGKERLNQPATTQRYMTRNHAPLDKDGNVKI